MNTTDILIALGLTMVAGLSTGIGSVIAFATKKTDNRFLSAAMGHRLALCFMSPLWN